MPAEQLPKYRKTGLWQRIYPQRKEAMNNTITPTQQRYILALLKSVGQAKFEEFKKELKIAKTTTVADLTKDEAFQLITRMISETSGAEVEQALAIALQRKAA
jgi:hypothetical protein